MSELGHKHISPLS